jgi:hypothetical protein
MTPEGFLLELVSSPKGVAGDAAAWYEGERMPGYLAVPGCERAGRYEDAEIPVASLVAYHFSDAAALDRLEREPTLRPHPSDAGRGVIERLFRLERRAYRLLGSYEREAPAPVTAPVLLAVWWEPQPGTEAELARWYEEEHIPRLLKVPGWIRISRYERIGGTGPRFLAVHDIEDIAAMASPAHRAALSTPWRTKVIAQREQYERRVFSLRAEVTAAPAGNPPEDPEDTAPPQERGATA